MRNEAILQQFNQFTKSIDNKIKGFIDLEDGKLTENVSCIQWDLWHRYKEINGTSAGFHGISEYIVFSVFKKFIEKQNNQKEPKPIGINYCLRFFELEKDNKTLKIYRSSSLKHYPLSSKLNRAPDIGIVKEEKGQKPRLIAVIEIKNYLDAGSLKSAIGILTKIRDSLKNNHIQYAIFSFGKIAVKNKKALKKFQEKENNYLIINTDLCQGKSHQKQKKENTRPEYKVTDLSEFLNKIKDELTL